jgi:hypothetical protein
MTEREWRSPSGRAVFSAKAVLEAQFDIAWASD